MVDLPEKEKKEKKAGEEKVREIEIDGDMYDIPTKQAIAISNLLVNVWVKLGKPDTPLRGKGIDMMKIIISSWEDTMPKEARLWKKDRSEHLAAEMDVKEQVKKKTGRILASYPGMIHALMKIVFPKFKSGKRENVIKLVQLFPMFKYVNKI
jgi:hypothetical protein